MLTVFNVIAPIFALMAFGYLAVRFKAFPQEGIKALIVFVNNFASPCLLFYSMLGADFGSAFNPAILAPFYLGAVICMVVGTLVALKFYQVTPGDAVSAGFSATFTNTVLVGLPIISRAYGDAALPVVFSIIGLHSALLLTLGMMTMEVVGRDGKSLWRTLGTGIKRIVSNPLIWGIAAGLIGNLIGLELIEPADAFFAMMSQAVVPAALFGIGGALVEYKLSDNWSQALSMSLIKLVLHPLIAYVLMIHVLHVDIDIARYGILLAAMPPGLNSYVFATYYNKGISVATNTILIATVVSAITISGWLLFLG